MVMVRALFPTGLPRGKKEACARCMKIVDRSEKTVHAARSENQTMKPAIRRFPRMNVASHIALARCLLGGIEYRRREMWRGMPQCQNFQRGAHFRHFADLLQVEGGNTHTAARLADRQPLRLKPAEGLANRHMARFELVGDMVLPKTAAGREFAVDDALGKHPAYTAGNGVVGIPAHVRSLE